MQPSLRHKRREGACYLEQAGVMVNWRTDAYPSPTAKPGV
jgi:hypothetical protein